MAVFPNNKFRSSSDLNSFGSKYRALMKKHPFLLFGLPFMSVIVGASFALTPVAAVRYERHDRKVRQVTRDEELNIRRSARKPTDLREEYYVSLDDYLNFISGKVRVSNSSCRNWLRKTSTTGSRNE
jgi:cytochrome c oxidase assembly protein subunit 16